MNKIWVVAVIFSFVFAPWASAEMKILDIELPEMEISTPTFISEGAAISDGERSVGSKFSVALGFGNAYKLGEQGSGLYQRDNGSVSFLQLGYSPLKYVEIQGESSRVKSFHRERSWGEQNERFNNYGLNLKLKAPPMFNSLKLSPYVVLGFGKSKMTYYGIVDGKSFSDSGSGSYRKTGAGIEIALNKNLVLFSEYNYYKMGLIKFHLKSGMVIENLPHYSVVFTGIGIKF